MRDKPQKLAIFSPLKAKKIAENQIILTQKFIGGVLQYQNYWPHQIVVFFEEDKDLSSNLDNVDVDIDQLPFQVEITNFDRIDKNQAFRESCVVLTGEGFRQNQISKLCKAKNIPCIYVSEYSLKTRLQNLSVSESSSLSKLKGYIWEVFQEKRQKSAIAKAKGIQCNGTPTYEDYGKLSKNSLLYFDSRVTESMLASKVDVLTRTAEYRFRKPLRLLFSGRLIRMKGADHLILVAQALRKLNVRFEMFICGDGELKPVLEKQIIENNLSDYVKMLGILDFKDELIPFVKSNVDLFVCCHRQGDPSCTYLETMSCGVPIVGYANEAFLGLVKHAKVGWPVAMNRPDLLAKKIMELDQNREAMVEASLKSLDFSKRHTFEKTFEKRINHIRETAGCC
jgi:colanic acid/amylovoran biosynthesis glycosyltransferase